MAAGNITVSDARVLKGITWQLYRHIYQKYDEMEKAGVNQLMEEAMILEVDIIEKKHRDEVKRIKADNEKVIQEKDNAIKAKDNAIKAKDNAIKELSEKLRHFGISEEEILKMTTLQPSP